MQTNKIRPGERTYCSYFTYGIKRCRRQDAGGQCGRRSVPEQARELQGTPKADRISAGEEKEACRHGKGGECVSVHFKPGAVYGFGIIQPGQRSEKILRPSAAYFKLFRK